MAENGLLLNAVAFVFSLVATAGVMAPAAADTGKRKQEVGMDSEFKGIDHVGMWVTGDGQIRHELLPNGRYVEARGNRERAYEGEYRLSGNHIDYRDDTGFVADGDFKDGILYHAGMVFYRQAGPSKTAYRF